MINDNPHQGKLDFVHKTAETSRAAFESVRHKISENELRVENHLLLAGRDGLTNAELVQHTGILIQTITPLTGKMTAAGKLVVVGDKRPTPTGRGAKIYRLPRYARAVAKGVSHD